MTHLQELCESASIRSTNEESTAKQNLSHGFKMKISILTQHLGHNYGGLLQAYALQKHLADQGHDVETLNRLHALSPVKRIKNSARKFLENVLRIPPFTDRRRLLVHLTDFRDKNLKLSPEIRSEHKLRRYYRDTSFDAFIVGSDQVWRPKYSPSIQNYYLDFLENTTTPVRRIAYAASFGVDVWEYPRELEARCKELVQKFTAVSVREISGGDLCRDHFDITPAVTVDPTMLLDPTEYEALMDTCPEVDKSTSLVAYILDPSAPKQAISDKISQMLGCQSFSILPLVQSSQSRRHHLSSKRYPPVEYWLKYIATSRFVVTDSFHGAVFSILFNKPFVAIANPERGAARFTSLLSQFDLGHRLVETPDSITPELLRAQINWTTVNARRVALATESSAFLKKSLYSS